MRVEIARAASRFSSQSKDKNLCHGTPFTIFLQRANKHERSDLAQTRSELLKEARSMTLSLYRLCLKSVRVIRYGNEHDEEEFVSREKRRLEKMEETDMRLSMISLLPPVDREDELRSRSEYYMQYTRENFVQEADCLSMDKWDRRHVMRYLHHLRKGNDHRIWLLSDMKFADPYEKVFDLSRIKKFEEQAIAYIDATDPKNLRTESRTVVETQSDEDYDDSSDDDDDDAQISGLPHWYKNPRSA